MKSAIKSPSKAEQELCNQFSELEMLVSKVVALLKVQGMYLETLEKQVNGPGECAVSTGLQALADDTSEALSGAFHHTFKASHALRDLGSKGGAGN
jgi:hypothetical protein